MDSMCRKNEVGCILLKLLHYFNPRIQCSKTCNSVHSKAFEVHHETYR